MCTLGFWGTVLGGGGYLLYRYGPALKEGWQENKMFADVKRLVWKAERLFVVEEEMYDLQQKGRLSGSEQRALEELQKEKQELEGEIKELWQQAKENGLEQEAQRRVEEALSQRAAREIRRITRDTRSEKDNE